MMYDDMGKPSELYLMREELDKLYKEMNSMREELGNLKKDMININAEYIEVSGMQNKLIESLAGTVERLCARIEFLEHPNM